MPKASRDRSLGTFAKQMIRFVALYLFVGLVILHGQTAPLFTGSTFDVEIKRIDQVTVDADKITLTGVGYPLVPSVAKRQNGFSDAEQPLLTIYIWKSTWESTHQTSWNDAIMKMDKLKRFSGKMCATDAGWGTYSYALFDVTCADLNIPKAK